MRLFLTFLLLLNFSEITAQATASFTASATIIEPIGIKTLSNLNFAEIDPRSGGGIILTPQGERIALGEVILENSTAVTAASFEVKGQQGYNFSISLPSGSYSLVHGEEQMSLQDFTSSIGREGTLGSGNATFRIGATLLVKAQQAPGFYSTSTPLEITVNYN
ncbi:DUF4402 domain-containing protein [Salinimicrobium oceani]|uniref:DUF4402 domain-containing protein n=1 Tax=Salinimicrobium oceani TaxID=2722702 RepID=A0ABX1CYK7_9FLAO|nr:DUF4402 domain-containing protein [Salinimicrobium oceani]NJW53345.1 DUF4402 domain-containing protein [Salinimicrobium oceani]